MNSFLIFISSLTMVLGQSKHYHIDSLVINQMTKNDNKSIENVCIFIQKHSTSKEETARGIYVWITNNIKYLTLGAKTKKKGHSARSSQRKRRRKLKKRLKGDLSINPKVVFQRKKTRCAGYASLFKEMSKTCGVECETISGYARTFKRGIQKLKEPGHAWNCILIDSTYYLIDATWGAGYVDGNIFVSKPNNEFWMTPPHEFIKTHLPNSPFWQILEYPVSKRAFVNGHTTIRRDMGKQKNGNYNFKDSIQTHGNELDSKSSLGYARSCYEFNKKVGGYLMGNYYEDLAKKTYIEAKRNNKSYNLSNLTQIKKLYTLAKKYFRMSTGAHSRSSSRYCKSRIKYFNKRIKRTKKKKREKLKKSRKIKRKKKK